MAPERFDPFTVFILPVAYSLSSIVLSVCVLLSRQQPFSIVAAQETAQSFTQPQRAVWTRGTGDSSCLNANKCLPLSDPFSQSLLLSANSPQSLSSDTSAFSDIPPCALSPDHEELVTMESVEYQQQEVSGGMENDPLSDSGYIELHYYETHQYLVLPGDTQLDLETVEILQLDAEAQEAAGSLLDLAGGGY